MEKRKKDIDKELDDLRNIAGRLEGSLDEEDAIDLMEKAVDKIEEAGKSLEEGE